MRSIIIEPQMEGQRLDKYIKRYLKAAPDSFIYKMLRKKNIILNGKKASGRESVSEGDEVKLFLSDETLYKFGAPGMQSGNSKIGLDTETIDSKADLGTYVVDSKNEPGIEPGNSIYAKEGCRVDPYIQAFKEIKGVSVIYEDENVLIVNKPAGLMCQKASQKDISLNEWLIGYLLNKGFVSKSSLALFKPSCAHRLDRNTAGLVICSKTYIGARKMAALIKDRAIKKYYICAVYKRDKAFLEVEKSSPSNREDFTRLTAYAVKDKASNKVSIHTDEKDGAARIITDYRILDKKEIRDIIPKLMDFYAGKHLIPDSYRELLGNTEFLEIDLITGKSHQIRAHLSFVGMPLLGDIKYMEKELYKKSCRQAKGFKLDHQFLISYKLVFPHMEAPFDSLSNMEIKLL